MTEYLSNSLALQSKPRTERIDTKRFGDDTHRIDRDADNAIAGFVNQMTPRELNRVLNAEQGLLINYLIDLRLQGSSTGLFSVQFQTDVAAIIKQAQGVKKDEIIHFLESQEANLLQRFIADRATDWNVAFPERFYGWAHLRLLNITTNKILAKAGIKTHSLYRPLQEFFSSLMMDLTDSNPPMSDNIRQALIDDARFAVPPEMLPDYTYRGDAVAKKKDRHTNRPDLGQPPTQFRNK